MWQTVRNNGRPQIHYCTNLRQQPGRFTIPSVPHQIRYYDFGENTMKKLIVTLATTVAILFTAGAANAAPANYEADWVPAMNQTSYWAPWQCTKYENHNGSIPAQYDAAIVKDGTRVRVYPDLTGTGAFTAQGPGSKQAPHSWVMKCAFPPATTTTTTTTTVPETTTTTTPPTATTVPETTVPPVDTTLPVTTPPAAPEVPVVTEPSLEEPVGGADPVETTTPAPPTAPMLPATGTSMWPFFWAGCVLVVAGVLVRRISNR
jgi:LPXTG-motif cell wall-anchored protein